MPIKGWMERRKREKEIERDMVARRGKATIQRYINKQKAASKELWNLGKEAVRIGDRRNFRQIMVQYLWTLDDVKRWERSLLTFRALEARKGQMRATGDFLQAIQSMSASILSAASPEEMVRSQQALEMGMARAQDMEERITMMLEMTDDAIFSPEGLDEEAVGERMAEFERAMTDEAEHEEGTELDSRIDETLKRIEQEMRRESR